MHFSFYVLKQYLPLFGVAFLNTLFVALVSLFFALIIGFIGGLCRVSKNKYINGAVSLYINIIRSTPLLAQLYLVFFGLPYLGVCLSPFATGVITLALNNGAYIAEIMRSGIQAISKGQIEASLSLGMTYFSMMRRIILPQAIVIIIPPLVGQLARLVKATSLLSIITYTELTRAADKVAADSFAPTTGYLTSAFLYFVICSFLMNISKNLEKRTNWMQKVI